MPPGKLWESVSLIEISRSVVTDQVTVWNAGAESAQSVAFLYKIESMSHSYSYSLGTSFALFYISLVSLQMMHNAVMRIIITPV